MLLHFSAKTPPRDRNVSLKIFVIVTPNNWRDPPFWYDTDKTIWSVKSTDYKSIVCVIPKEGSIGGAVPVNPYFAMTWTKFLKDGPVTTLNSTFYTSNLRYLKNYFMQAKLQPTQLCLTQHMCNIFCKFCTITLFGTTCNWAKNCKYEFSLSRSNWGLLKALVTSMCRFNLTWMILILTKNKHASLMHNHRVMVSWGGRSASRKGSTPRLVLSIKPQQIIQHVFTEINQHSFHYLCTI